MSTPTKTRKRAQVSTYGRVLSVEKADGIDETDLGLVWGVAIVSTVGGKPYVDLQDEHIPADVMKRAATKFMRGTRTGKVMHEGATVGQIVHSVPLDNTLGESLAKEGVLAEGALLKEVWLIAFAPDSVETRKQFDDGVLTGFSIAGDGWVTDETFDDSDIAADVAEAA